MLHGSGCHPSGSDRASLFTAFVTLVTLASILAATSAAFAQEVPEKEAHEKKTTGKQDATGDSKTVEQTWSHVGLLRGRDLSPFGLLRLDMLPAHTADAEAGTWTFEVQMAYQNTFVLSENARDYLETRNIGRQPLRPGDAAQVIPTLIAGYGYGLTRHTSLILQGYASRSAIQNSTVEELTDDEYQLSIGVQSRSKNILWSFAITENVTNFENTPDIGAQMSFAYMPKAK